MSRSTRTCSGTDPDSTGADTTAKDSSYAQNRTTSHIQSTNVGHSRPHNVMQDFRITRGYI